MAGIRACLTGVGDEGSARLVGREMGRVWGDIVDIAFARVGSHHFALPHDLHVSHVKRIL